MQPKVSLTGMKLDYIKIKMIPRPTWYMISGAVYLSSTHWEMQSSDFARVKPFESYKYQSCQSERKKF